MKERRTPILVWICGNCQRDYGHGSCAKENAANCCACLTCKGTILLNGTQYCAACTADKWVTQAKRQLDDCQRIYDEAVSRRNKLKKLRVSSTYGKQCSSILKVKGGGVFCTRYANHTGDHRGDRAQWNEKGQRVPIRMPKEQR